MMNRSKRRLALVLGAFAALTLAGCGVNDKLLNTTDPDLINPGDIDTPDGAEALRIGTLSRWRLTTGGDNANGNDNTWLFGGLLADEWATASTFVQNDEVDERRTKLDNSTVTFAFRKLHRVRTAANQAIPAMRKFFEDEHAKIAELYLARGYAEMQLASDFCNGIPLSDAAGDDINYGPPLSVAEVFNVSIATLDSGLTEINGLTDADSKNVRNALLVTKARAQLGINQVAEAATTVAAVPADFTYEHTFAASSGDNAIWGQPNSARRYNVGNNLEGNDLSIPVANNLDFFSANDPRVPAEYTVEDGDTTTSQDGQTLSRTTSLWGQETSVTVASYLDAQLIVAEAKLKANDGPGMMTILNALRAAPPQLGDVQPAAMAPLADPVTPEARLDLLFREKAFWTFSRGQRLGDLRRLIRFYGRTPANTFPTGGPIGGGEFAEHYRGGAYGSDVNLPVPQQEENNPNFHGCTDRNA
jgi:hypothetical protein